MVEQFDLNKALLSVVIGLLGWNVWKTHTMAIEVAVLSSITASSVRQAEMVLLKSEVSKLSSWVQNLSDRLDSVDRSLRQVQ